MRFRPSWGSLLLAATLAAASLAGTADATSASAGVARTAAKQLLASRQQVLRACLRAHPHRCASARRAVSSVRTLLASPGHSSGYQPAPVITVSGQTLRWNQVGNGWYVFVRKVASAPDRYSVIEGDTITPPAVPGATVRYSVRPYRYYNSWAHEVAIAYPPASSTGAAEPAKPPAGGGTQTGPAGGGAETGTSSGGSSRSGSGSESGSGSGGGSGSGSGGETGSGGSGGSGGSEGGSGGSGGSEGGEGSNPETFGLPFVKGVNSNLAGWGTSSGSQIAAEMNAIGVSWEREDLSWAEAEPLPGVYHWSSFETVLAEAKANGIKLLPIVGYAPSWTSPTNASAYAEFVAAAVARFGPGTSANLQWWELWNEPYFAYAWSDRTPEPAAYAKDALAAAKAAKAVSPSVKLLLAADYSNAPQTGGSSQWETSWIDDMFTAAPTLGQWVDGVSVHPYGDDPSTPLSQSGSWKDASGQWAFQRIDTIHAKFLAHGVNVPYWITEEGWSTWEVTESTLAKSYSDLVTQVKARPWVRALFPFCLREFSGNPTNNQPGFGLLKFGSWQQKAGVQPLVEGLKTLS